MKVKELINLLTTHPKDNEVKIEVFTYGGIPETAKSFSVDIDDKNTVYLQTSDMLTLINK